MDSKLQLELNGRYIVDKLQYSYQGYYSSILEIQVIEESEKSFLIKIKNDKSFWFLKKWYANIIDKLPSDKINIMDVDGIHQILKSYDEVINLIKTKVHFMKEIDSEMYNTCYGIEKIAFYDGEYDVVTVICDNSCSGDNETHTFEFPTSYLTLSDEDLIKRVELDKKIRDEKREQEIREIQLKADEEKEKNEYKVYLELKEKYEPK